MVCARFYHTKKVNYVDFGDNFLKNIFLEIHTNIPQMLHAKFEIIISIIKLAVAIYIKAKKIDPICLFSTHRGKCHKLFYLRQFRPGFFTQHTQNISWVIQACRF